MYWEGTIFVVKRSRTLSRKKHAFTIIEILVDFAIVALVATAIVAAFASGYNAIQLAKAKITAVAIANENIEEIRNMSYDSLATEHGAIYPPGNLQDSQIVTEKNIKFEVQTIVSYVDDPYDGNALGTIPGKPTDLYPYDYKRVKIFVYKVGRPDPLAQLVTDVSSKAAETQTNTGILYLCVIDANNNPVVNSDVTIQNPNISPAVDMATVTDDTGCVQVPGLPPDSHNEYHIIVTKDGYSTDMTYPRTSQNPNELQPDVDILAQKVTRLTLTIDKVSTFKITTRALDGAIIPNLSLHITGAKLKYFNPSTPVYSADLNCNGSGFLQVDNLAFDDYSFLINTAGNYVSSTNPVQPIHLAPDIILEVTIYVTNSASAPRIYSITPQRGVIPDLAMITVTGTNFDNVPASVKLMNSTTGQEIVGTDISVHAHTTLSADFNLGTGTIGKWDVYIQNANGEFVRQKDGFEIVNQ